MKKEACCKIKSKFVINFITMYIKEKTEKKKSITEKYTCNETSISESRSLTLYKMASNSFFILTVFDTLVLEKYIEQVLGELHIFKNQNFLN